MQTSINGLNEKVDVEKVSTAISTAVGTETSNRTAAINALDSAYKAADAQIRKDYADADATTLQSAKDYADGAAGGAESAAKSYADGIKNTVELGYAAADSALENKYKDRPFVAVETNDAQNWVVFNCGNAQNICMP